MAGIDVICKQPSLLPPLDSVILEFHQKEHLPTVVHGHNLPSELLLAYRVLLLQVPSWVSGKNEDRKGE